MIKIENLNYKYKSNTFALKDINLTIPDGEFVCIIGENGSGKSTFSKIISGLSKFKNGDIYINDLDLKNTKNSLEMRKKIGVVFQNPENQILFDTVYDDIIFSLKNLDIPSTEFETRIEDSLKKVNMLEYKKSATHELSLGQKQRIAIASSLAINPSILILDEPTTMLDPMSKNKIYDILSDLRKEGITIIFITNSIDEILISDRILLFNDGKIIKDFYKKDLINNLDYLKDFQTSGIISIIHKLNQKGIDIDLDIFSIDELVEKISK